MVTADWLVQALYHPALCLLDVREAASFDEGHIPGAVRVDLASLNREVDGVPGMLLSAERFARTMGRLGVSHRRPVVLYDDNWGLPAARVLWALTRYGHTNVAVLNGGIDRWQEEDLPVSTEATVSTPASFHLQPQDEHLATRECLEEQIDNSNVVLLDTRAPGEFAAGHLPGAICWDWINGVPLGSWDAMRPPGELRQELAQLGVTSEKEIVTYCRTGARAAHTYLLLRHLGFPRVRLYDGSWLDWSRHTKIRKELAHDDEV
ncbi:MAG TPA: sulfurtransferase [Candidatus Sulfomarinibacteraceae bacterium]|nr:sulfurtransferase [Candidatus Sulfomarinibacteraceae bacterium]